ncbi:hypothetical protein VD659_01340 [Herbiconiux sp. 11R-BC]|uniref:hypothetical protein n=1 Tax=Herbiconiux sp. 11R-BC TaxID=3111637 RepID=UPI003BFF8A1E
MSLWVVSIWIPVLAVPAALIFFATLTLTHALWRHTPLLAPLLGIVGLALAAWLSFLAWWAWPPAGFMLCSLTLIASAVVFVRGGIWRGWREALPVLALMAGGLLFAVSFSYLWGAGNDPYSLVAGRFFHFLLPSDNTIPMLFGQKLSLGQSTTLLTGDWNGGDRPPLQTGFELLFSPLVAVQQAASGAAVVGFGGTMPMGAAFAADVLAQVLWIPAGYVLLRLLGFRSWIAIASLVFSLMIPSILVNTVFTWPKMLSAGLVLTAIGFLLAVRQNRTAALWPFLFAVIAATLAVLAHGAAAFTIPALVLIGLYALRGRGIRPSFGVISWGAACGLLLYAPWAAYQRFVDPPGDRLLKWHLAGWVPVTPDSFVDVLVRQYTSTPVSELIGNRLANVGTLFGLDEAYRFTGPGARPFVALRVEDWTSTLFALGPIAVAAGIVILVLHLVRVRELDDIARQRLLVVAAMLVCIAVWATVLFSANATIVAQGSHCWMLVLAIVPFAWLLERRPRLGLTLIGVQAAAFVTVYFLKYSTPEEPARLSISAAVLATIGLVFVLVGPILLARRARPATAVRFR